MRDANLTLIQTFFVVARSGSYSAAARALNMSYQSAANHVRRLEQLLGEQLRALIVRRPPLDRL